MKIKIFLFFIFHFWYTALIAKPFTNQVIITANLKATGFEFVPVDILINDFLDKKSITFERTSYDSATGFFKGVFSISEPQLMLFFLKEVYVTPGDSIHLKYIILKNLNNIYKDTLIASGINEANYRYYTFFRNEYTFSDKKFPTYSLSLTLKDLTKYREKLKIYYYGLKKRLLKPLNQTNHSSYYRTFAVNSIQNYMELNYLNAYSTIKKKRPQPYMLAKIKNYLIRNIDTNSHVFFEVLLMLHKVSSFEGSDYGVKEFRSLQADAQSYPGLLRDYLITVDILDFIKNKRGANLNLSETIQIAYNNIYTPKYKNKIGDDKIDFFSSSEKIPPSLDSIKFVDINGQILTFGNIVSKSTDTIIYIDFWASWCVPCKRETPSLKKMHNVYKKNSIKYIQISLDAENKNWRKAVEKENILFSDNYRILNYKDFLLFNNELSFNGIPYYLLIDKMGDISVRNAPRPSETKEIAKIFKLINIKK